MRFLCHVFLAIGVLGISANAWGNYTAAERAHEQPNLPDFLHPDPYLQPVREQAPSVVTLPMGTPLTIYIREPVSTAINRSGDPVEGLLAQDVYVGERRVLAKDSRLRGALTRVEPPIAGRDAILAARFHELVPPEGQPVAIIAHVQTVRPDHAWGGALTRGTVPKRVVHNVTYIGAYNKEVWTGPRAMGGHIAFPPADRWIVILEAPLTVETGAIR